MATHAVITDSVLEMIAETVSISPAEMVCAKEKPARRRSTCHTTQLQTKRVTFGEDIGDIQDQMDLFVLRE